jgi:RimJ/RimL family protein N-acetyltransferase
MDSPSLGPWPRRTERLVLRAYRPADGARLLEIRNRPEVWNWMLKTRVDRVAFQAAWLRSVDDPHDQSVVVELDGTVIGTGSLDVLDGMGQDQAGPTQRSEGLIGYIVDPRYAGRGFATEIAGELLSVAFEQLGLRRVTAACFADNSASWRVMEKLGMRREQHGVEDSWHAELGWLDGYTYAVLAEEWLAANRDRTTIRSREG